MDSLTVIDESRLNHVRELKTAVAKLRADNAALRDENAMLRAHLDMAIAAAADLAALPEDGRLVFIDGWNLILGSPRVAKDREELLAQARNHLAERPQDLVWIVYDGPRANCTVEGRLRVSWTGGEGEHRADRFICDFVRMARFRGDAAKIEVRTNDRDFRRELKRLLGR